MNEKSDEPAKRSAEPDQSAAQDQPQHREVSQEELKQILEAHQKWLESDGKEGERANLSSANLSSADLSSANLQRANLRFAKLQEAYLFRANLQGANLFAAELQGADLRFASLQKADLRRADLRGADLNFANLQGANLTDAYLQKAYLFRANLQEANLRGAEGVTASQIKETLNWQLAFYNDGFLKELGLPADHNKTLKKKLAEMEEEKEKTATKP